MTELDLTEKKFIINDDFAVGEKTYRKDQVIGYDDISPILLSAMLNSCMLSIVFEKNKYDGRKMQIKTEQSKENNKLDIGE